MGVFGPRSLKNLSTCIPDAQTVANAARLRIAFVVIEGHRGKSRQNEMFAEGLSAKQYPDGNHNTSPSLAFDFIFQPFIGTDADWKNDAAFKAVADIIIEEAAKIGIVVVWGGTWTHPHDTDHIQFVSKNGVPYPRTFLEAEV